MCTAAVYRTKDTYFGRTLLLIFTQWLAYTNILKFDRKEDSHVRF